MLCVSEARRRVTVTRAGLASERPVNHGRRGVVVALSWRPTARYALITFVSFAYGDYYLLMMVAQDFEEDLALFFFFLFFLILAPFWNLG